MRNDLADIQSCRKQALHPLPCAGDFPANLFLLLDTVEGLQTQEVRCSLKLPGWLKPGDLRTCCLKMFPAFSRMTRGGRLLSSSPRWMSWGIMSSGQCLTAPYV